MEQRPEGGLKLYGGWIEELCAILQTNKAEVARRAEVKQNTMSDNLRKSQPRDVEGVRRIWEVFRKLAIEQQKFDLLEERDAFLWSAGIVTENMMTVSRTRLAELEQRYPRDQYRRIKRNINK